MDLGAFSNLAGGIGALIGSIVAFWNFFIKPGQIFKANISDKINELTNELEKLKIKVDSLEKELQKDIDKNKEDVVSAIDSIKEEYETLSEEIEKHIIKIDSKNEKLLNMLIKYFNKEK